MEHDGAGDQPWEEGHIQNVIQEAVIVIVSFSGLDQARDLLEGKIADAQGEHKIQVVKIAAGQGIEVLQQEIKVLEIAQQGNIGDDAHSDDQPAAIRKTPQQHTGQIVHQNAACKDIHIGHILVSAENQRCDHQRQLRGIVLSQAVQTEVCKHRQRQKTENKNVRIK